MRLFDRLASWADRLAPDVAPDKYAAAGGMVPVRAYSAHDINDPLLADFLRDGRVSSAGVSVNEGLALRNSTLFRAVNLISGSMGMLPTHLMRTGKNGSREKAVDHPLYRVLMKRPNAFQTPFEFKSFMQSTALLDGNAYGLIIRQAGKIRAIVPLKRRSVTPKLSDSFSLSFEYQRPSGGRAILASEDVFHFRHPVSRDGLRGLDLLDVATNSLGLATQAETAASRLFRSGTMVGGALETDKTLGEEAIGHLRQSMEDRHSGAENSARWMILEDGLKAKPLAGSAKDSQHIETRQHQAEEIARFTGVPRPLLMFDETSWGSGIEQLGLFFVTYCLMPWFVAWEQAIQRSCLTEAEQDQYYVKFNEGALLRGSLKDQAEFFAKALGAGGSGAYMVPNEVRDKFDLNPIPGGDELPTSAAAHTPPSPNEPPDEDAPPARRKRKTGDDDE